MRLPTPRWWPTHVLALCLTAMMLAQELAAQTRDQPAAPAQGRGDLGQGGNELGQVIGDLTQRGEMQAAETRPWASLGRVATPNEIAAWDIDVRADFKGLPAGRGSVADGMIVWEERCADCHGTFGESNEVFAPIVGGTSEEDIRTGRVAALAGRNYAQRTTMMKMSQLSSLWDYINRAMPWDAPKSLTHDQVYAVTAYILNLADVVESDFELTEKNISRVQQRIPNRNGLVRFEPMWRIDGRPDVQGDACLSACEPEPGVTSTLPDHARGVHGNLAEQNRIVGPVRGVDTLVDRPTTLDETRTLAGLVRLAPEVDRECRAASTGTVP